MSPRSAFAAAALVALRLAAGCAPADTPTPDGWTRQSMAEDAYSLALPPGLSCVPLQGIDSDVARCDGDGLRLTLDWGMHGGVPTGHVETETVGGREVRLRREGEGFVAGFVVPPIDLGDGSRTPSQALTVHVACSAEAACETARDVVRTVRIPETSRSP